MSRPSAPRDRTGPTWPLRSPIALVAYCLALWLPGVLSVPPSDRDESRFAQATKQMLETGDFVTIRNGEEARNRKPVGIHWLQAPFAAVARATGLADGNPIWPYRIPSVLGGLLAVCGTALLWRGAIGREPALLAGFMLGGSMILAVETGIAKTDAALLGATTLVMGLLARAYLRPRPLTPTQAGLFWVALGGAVLIKGPVTPMIAGLTALALLLADRRVRGADWLGRLRPAMGAPLLLVVVLPWFVAIGIATHGTFFSDAVGGDLGGKLAGGDDAHGAPPGLHLLLLPALLLPVAIPAMHGLYGGWRDRADPVVRFLLAWIVPAWIVFELVPTKLPHYPLPLYPAICLLAARWTLDPAHATAPRWLARSSTAAFLVAGALLATFALALPFVVAPGLGPRDLLGLPALLAAGLMTWLVLQALARQDWPRVAWSGLLAAPLLIWSVLAFELPRLAPLWIAPRVEAALKAHWLHGRPPGALFGAAGFREPSLMFLVGTDTQWLSGGAEAAAFLAASPGRVAAVDGRDLAAFETASARLGFAPHVVAEIPGYNYSRGRRVRLTLFDRSG